MSSYSCFLLQVFPNIKKQCMTLSKHYFARFSALNEQFDITKVRAADNLDPLLFCKGGSQDVEARFDNRTGQVTVIGLKAAAEQKMNEIKAQV